MPFWFSVVAVLSDQLVKQLSQCFVCSYSSGSNSDCGEISLKAVKLLPSLNRSLDLMKRLFLLFDKILSHHSPSATHTRIPAAYKVCAI